MELPYERIYTSLSGGWVDLHPLHGEDELADNLEACRLLADHGFKIELLPCLPVNEIDLRKELSPDVFGNKNPDVRINGFLIGDIKSPDTRNPIKKSTINNAINSAAIQKVEVAILNLSGRHYTIQDIKKGIVGALQPDRNKSIKQIWIITQTKDLFTITREFVFEDILYKGLHTHKNRAGDYP